MECVDRLKVVMGKQARLLVSLVALKWLNKITVWAKGGWIRMRSLHYLLKSESSALWECL